MFLVVMDTSKVIDNSDIIPVGFKELARVEEEKGRGKILPGVSSNSSGCHLFSSGNVETGKKVEFLSFSSWWRKG